MELKEIKGIGARRVQALNEMGIFTPSDLLLRFPDKYIFTDCKLDRNLRENEEISFIGEVVQPASKRYLRRGLSVVTCIFANNGITVKCSWFNQPFAARYLKVGDKVYVIGKVKKFKNTVQLTNPTLITPNGGDKSILPVYKTAIPSRTFAAAVDTALRNVRINSYIPPDIARNYGLIPLQQAISSMHFPSCREELGVAKRSVAIENLCYVITTYRLLKDDKRDHKYNAPVEFIDKFEKSLPFELTDGQKRAIRRIVDSMRSDKLMNMLVQGEVGCGKTAVAMCVMYYAAMSGYQSAVMTPTEVLARQHYKSMVKILEPLGVKTQLLCASMSKQERDTALFNIKYGAVSCVVGTQSLIGEDIAYSDLKLVIVDEQQRFGVNQRAKLESKGGKTDVIVMTATPIPRTLALSLYGELQQIEIRELPANRPKITTRIVPRNKIEGMYNYIGECARTDGRTYIICPRISDTDEELTAVEQVYEKLRSMPFGNVVGCVHGKMKDAERVRAMSDFADGKTKILISTTVIEVGIDVPQATNVIIYDAERFGLAQLHQIRGRVGRGTRDSYCFLLTNNDNADSIERLKKFCEVTDGFSVSELDFRLRGAGDFVGLRQHGNGSLEIDEEIISRSRALSDALIADGSSSAAIVRSMSDPEFIRSVTMN